MENEVDGWRKLNGGSDYAESDENCCGSVPGRKVG
jgi:hypothetical protein